MDYMLYGLVYRLYATLHLDCCIVSTVVWSCIDYYMDLYRLLYGFDLSIVWFCIDYYLDLYRHIYELIVYFIGVIYRPIIKKKQAKNHCLPCARARAHGKHAILCRVQGQGTWQSSHCLPCEGARAHGKQDVNMTVYGYGFL